MEGGILGGRGGIRGEVGGACRVHYLGDIKICSLADLRTTSFSLTSLPPSATYPDTMPCGGSTQVFAFAALSSSSQLALASCMTTSALLDFASASPVFAAFLHTNCEEVVLAALQKQYGYIPNRDTGATHDTLRATPRTSSCRRHKRVSRDTPDLLLELPMLQRLLDEEFLPEHGKRLLALLPNSPQAPSIYGAGIRGLLRYRQYYVSLLRDGTTRADLHQAMQQWLEERYTNWGVYEMVSVIDALSSRVDMLLPSLCVDAVQREQLLGSLFCSMELLRLATDGSEETALQMLAARGVIEFLPQGRWRVMDASHTQWFSGPAQRVLYGTSKAGLYNHDSASAEREYVLGRGQGREEDGQASAGSPADAGTPRGMKLVMMAGAVARGARTKRAVAGGGRPDRAGLVERGVGWGWDVGCLNRWYGSNNG